MLKLVSYTALFCVLSLSALAQVPHYTLNASKSALKFVATQNNAPIEGEFKDFSGDIRFDPEKLKESSVKVTVNMASVATAYDEVAKSLAGTDWFSTAAYPTATLETITIQPYGGKNAYLAQAELTMRGKTVPVDVSFIVEQLTPEIAIATGRVTLLRTQFGVGQGKWTETNAIRDNVSVTFRAVAYAAK